MKTVKLNGRQEKAVQTKKKIQECAEYLFGKYGFSKVSVDSIVERAEVSKGSFYVHFASKDVLIAGLISDYIGRLDLDYESFIESFPPNTLASTILLSFCESIVNAMTDTIGYDVIKYVYEIQMTRSIDTRTILGYDRHIYKIVNSIISRGIMQGEFKADLNADELTRHYLLSIRGIAYEWCIRHPDFNFKEVVNRHIELLLSGIKKQ